jgi:LysR family transcriptional regulator, cyn operon transcriptional activator
MNLYHLKYFYDSARLGSLTKAAQLNRVGQPAISKAIQNIEGVFKKTLISRFQLTEDGEVAFRYCEKIFSATDELSDALMKSAQPHGVVKWACPSSLADTELIANVVQAVHRKYPFVSLKLMLGRTDLIRDWVANGVVDFGLILNNVELADVEAQVLRKGFFYLIKGKRYAGDWRQDGIFTVENKREVIELKRKYEGHFGQTLKIKMEIGSWSVIKRFTLSGLGVGFVPDYMIQPELTSKKLVLIEPKKLAIPYEIQLIRKSEKYMSSRCRAVIAEFGHV